MEKTIATNENKQRFEELLKQICNSEKYRYRVFWGPGIYFAFVNDGIKTISDDAGSSPKGGWFPAIVTGPTPEEAAYLQNMMAALGFDNSFFCEYMEDYLEFDEDEAEEYFEDGEDEASLEIYFKIKETINSENTPFESMAQFASALARYELDDDLYYEWEGDYIHFFNNICDVGEAPGYYDDISIDEWIEIFENIDSHFVTAD